MFTIYSSFFGIEEKNPSSTEKECYGFTQFNTFGEGELIRKELEPSA